MKLIGRTVGLTLILLLGGGAAAVWWLPEAPPRPPSARAERRQRERFDLTLATAPNRAGEKSWSQDEFDFGETIYATVSFPDLSPGWHRIAFSWISPRGRVEQRRERQVDSTGGPYRVWSWLRLRGEEYCSLPLGPWGPSRYHGRWRIGVELDGLPLGGGDFRVR